MARKNLATIGISCAVILFTITSLNAQVFDDFSDGNLSANPPWKGDTSAFEVNDQQQLHLKSSGTDSAGLVTESVLLDSTEWIFWIRLAFSPSANNYCRIYLASDNPDLSQPLNGFFLQLGEAGSSDALELFRQQGSLKYSICRGKEGFIASSFAVRIRITRSTDGYWSLSADSTGGYTFLEQASALDNTAVDALYSGLWCRFTSSNATKFYFDEITVRPIEADLIPPQLLSIKVPDNQTLLLRFTEALDPDTSVGIQHYFAGSGMGNPSLAQFEGTDLTCMKLTFSGEFTARQPYNLSVSGLSDLAGNQMSDTLMSFVYYHPESYDIVINEIMADPEPQVGLPPVEYLELFNRTEFTIDLDGWKVQTGNTIKYIPDYSLPPRAYVVLADSNARPLFPPGVSFLGFPTFSLANDGCTLTLLDSDNKVIHSLTYSSDWYSDPLKDDGGWSLEQIDPDNPCGGKGNWRSSTALKGGTPGYLNSVNDENPDDKPPLPLYISVSDPACIRVHFSEPLDSTCLKGITSFRVNPGGLSPAWIKYNKPDYSSVDLGLHPSMETSTLYSLEFMDTLTDCAGNCRPAGYSLSFGLPLEPVKSDIIINEILFNPDNSVPEFFELFNNSDKIISLKSLVMAEIDSITLGIAGKYELTPDGRLFFPREYLAFTSNPSELYNHYYKANPSAFILMSPFPSLTNTAGSFSIINRQDEIIDPVKYNEDMHFPLLSTTKGVSLERISASTSGMKPENWHSASSTCGYATPAMKNSQAYSELLSSSDISMEPPVFSPDNDGYQDLLMIKFNNAKPGYLLTIQIYNTAGQPVKTLASNALLGNEDVFMWDGVDDKGFKSPIGMYIVYFELFNTTGEVRQARKVTVLGAKL